MLFRLAVYNGHLREPVTLTPVAERLTVELSQSVLTTLSLSRLGFEHPIFRLRGERFNPLRHRRGHYALSYQEENLGRHSKKKLHNFVITQKKTGWVFDALCHSRYGMLKNPHCPTAISAEHRSKFASLHRQQ